MTNAERNTTVRRKKSSAGCWFLFVMVVAMVGTFVFLKNERLRAKKGRPTNSIIIAKANEYIFTEDEIRINEIREIKDMQEMKHNIENILIEERQKEEPKAHEIILGRTDEKTISAHILELKASKKEKQIRKVAIRNALSGNASLAVNPKEFLRLFASEPMQDLAELSIHNVRCEEELEEEKLQELPESMIPVEEQYSEEERAEEEFEIEVLFKEMTSLSLVNVSEKLITSMFLKGSFPALKSLVIDGALLTNIDVLKEIDAPIIESIMLSNINTLKALDVNVLKSFGELDSLGLVRIGNFSGVETDREELAYLLKTLHGEVSIDWEILFGMAEHISRLESKRNSEYKEEANFEKIEIKTKKFFLTGTNAENYTAEKKEKIDEVFTIVTPVDVTKFCVLINVYGS